MDAREALYTTRAMRRLKPDPVPDDVVERILDAGTRAPCGGNEQTWRFVVVRDRSTMAELAVLYRAGLDDLYGDYYAETDGQAPGGRDARARQSQRIVSSARYLADHFEDVPLCIFGYRQNRYGEADGASMYPALWQMCLAARIEGLGSTMTTLLSGPIAGPSVDDLLGVPSDGEWRQFGMLPIGYPLGRWGVAARRPLNEVVFVERWGTQLNSAVTEPLWQSVP